MRRRDARSTRRTDRAGSVRDIDGTLRDGEGRDGSGGQALTGPWWTRIGCIVGAVVALLNVVLTVGGVVLSPGVG